MTPITYSTLGDYASTYTLHAHCPGCRRSVVIDPGRTAKVTGWQITLPALKAALTCSRCGRRGAHLSVVSDGRPGRSHVSRPGLIPLIV